MNTILQKISLLFICVIAMVQTNAQTTVTADASAAWTGYMNVFDLSNNYQFGGGWGLLDVKTVVDAGANTITLKPNYNTYNATDAYWSNGAIGNKIMEGNTFVESTSLGGQTVTFNGNVTANTLDAGYTAIAFIKVLDPAMGYATTINQTVTLPAAGTPFSVMATIPSTPGLIIQYGFQVRGINANPTAEAALGSVVVGPTVSTTPMVAAPVPTKPAANVISLFSNTYTNVPVNTWNTGWSVASLTDLQIAGNDTKLYTNLDFNGIEAVGANTINASTMTTFNVDIWTPNATTFKVKLVDFGADAAYGGGDDVEHEVALTPTLSGWNSYHLPLSTFTNLTTKAHIAQIILSAAPAGTSTVYMDNMYFSNEPPVVPMVPAPIPTVPSADVVSIFSNTYPNVSVDTWKTSWSNATLTDLQIMSNDTKRYSNLDFVGIEATGSNLIDASVMNFFNIDVWTPNATTFRVKLVDFGADGLYGGGDDVEHEVALTPSLSGWNSFHIPLSSFANLTTREHIAQIILSALPTGTADVYVDNMYFSITSPLAIVQNSFTATLQNDVVVLNWKSSTDLANKAYVVEKSIDGKTFNTVTEVTAKNASNLQAYQATDVLSNNVNTMYYRIKEVKLDGSSSYSYIVSVSIKTGTIALAPNPATDVINVIANNSQVTRGYVCNALGNIVKQFTISNNITAINVSDLATGVYYVKFSNGTSQSFVKK